MKFLLAPVINRDMPRRRVELSPSAKEVSALIRNGKLFEVEAWVKSGKSLKMSELGPWSSMLYVAVDTGFHSLVKVVINGEKWDQEELSCAMNRALYNRRWDLVELLLDAGAPAQDANLHEICRTMEPRVIERFLRAGVDPQEENAFAHVLSEFKVKPLLRVYRDLRQEFPVLDRQASLALSEAIGERNLRWTSLLAWAGADPLRPVPYGLSEEWTDDPDYGTSAAIRACMTDNLAYVRALKLKPNPEQARELVYYASFRPTPEIIKYLLNLVPKNELNEGENDSCKALESLVKSSHRDYSWISSGRADEEKHILESVELLLDHGARWNPPDNDLSCARRGLGTRVPKHVVQLIRLLLYTPGAAQAAIPVCEIHPQQSIRRARLQFFP